MWISKGNSEIKTPLMNFTLYYCLVFVLKLSRMKDLGEKACKNIYII